MNFRFSISLEIHNLNEPSLMTLGRDEILKINCDSHFIGNVWRYCFFSLVDVSCERGAPDENEGFIHKEEEVT